MHADDFVINDSRAGEAVEGVAECLPKLNAETTTTLVIESIYPVNPSALVVASKDEKVFGVLNLISKQQTHNFK